MKVIRVFSLILNIFLFSLFNCSKSDKENIIAQVGHLQISEHEFRQRFELNPRLKQFRNIEEAKIKFLGSLLAEKLFALEAQNSKLKQPTQLSAFLLQIERETTIEELYNLKIASKINISDEEIRDTYKKSNRELQIEYFNFKEKNSAGNFVSYVNSGVPYEQAFQKINKISENALIDRGQLNLSWGNTSPEIEDIAFSMKVDEISKPIKIIDQYFVIRIISEKINMPTESDFQKNKLFIEKNLKRQKKKAAFINYFKNMMVGKKTDVPPELLKYLVDDLEKTFNIGSNMNDKTRIENPAPVSNKEYSLAIDNVDHMLFEKLITFDDGTFWTMKEFLQRLSVGRFPLDFSDSETFKSSIRHQLLSMIEQEYIYKEAVKEGIDHSKNVIKETQIWRGNLEAKLFVQSIILNDSTTYNFEEKINLSSDQLTQIYSELEKLVEKYEIKINIENLKTLELQNAGLLVLKKHFPGRLVTPLTIPFENFSSWQNVVNQLIQ